MSPTEVVGVEIKQYVDQDNLTTLVARVVGQTEQARAQKIGGQRAAAEVGWDDYEASLQPDRLALVRSLFERIEERSRRLTWAGYRGSGRGISRSSVPAVTTVWEQTSAATFRLNSGLSCPRLPTSDGDWVTTYPTPT